MRCSVPPYLRGFVVVLLFCAAGSGAWGAIDPNPAVQNELRDRRRFPWYDAQEGVPRPVDVRPSPEPARPQSWPRIEAWLDSWANRRPARWPRLGRWLSSILEVLAWGILIALTLYLFYMMFRAARRMQGTAEQSGSSSETVADLEQLELLPADIDPRQRDLLAAARACYARGDYNQAMIFLFSYQLMRLDKRHLLRLEKGKTNRQYLRELAAQPSAAPTLRSMLQESTIAFEEVFFGRRVLGADRFEQLWRRVDEFHGLLQPTEARAT